MARYADLTLQRGRNGACAGRCATTRYDRFSLAVEHFTDIQRDWGLQMTKNAFRSLLATLTLTLADVEAVEFDGNSSNDYAAAAKKFVDAHPEKVQTWLAQ